MPKKTAVVSLVLGLSLAACTTEEPTDFTDSNRSGFLAACTLPLEDPPLIADVCECAVARFEEKYDSSIGRFAEIEEQLKEDPDQPLPDEITEIIAECVIVEGEL